VDERNRIFEKSNDYWNRTHKLPISTLLNYREYEKGSLATTVHKNKFSKLAVSKCLYP
jgi:hypothetical protein